MHTTQIRHLTKGRRVLCRYHGSAAPGGDAHWHERLLIGQVDDSGFVWIVATPDSDVYEMDFRTDVEFVRVLPMRGGRPAGLVGPIYPFRAPPTAAERAAWEAEARELLGTTSSDDYVPAAQPSPTAPGSEDDDVSVCASAPARPGKGSGGTSVGGWLSAQGARISAPVVAGKHWMCVSDATDDSVAAGTILEDNFEKCWTFGTRGVFISASGSTMFGELQPIVSVGVCSDRAQRLAGIKRGLERGHDYIDASLQQSPHAAAPVIEGDARCLPVVSRGGRRRRTWIEVAECSSEVEMPGWPVDGPRSALWVAHFLARFAGGGPEAYHRWWRTVSKLTVADWGVAEHAQLCRYLQLGGEWDQLDMGNLSIIEAIARRLQLIEYQYRDRCREGTRGASGGAVPFALSGLAPMGADEADLFDGLAKADTGACVCPKVVEWISAELKKTADIDKAARKAREERALARGVMNLEQPVLVLTPEDSKAAKKGGKKG